MNHNHDLDDKLHPGDCPMCDLIIQRREGTALRAKSADQMADRYAKIAKTEGEK